jgi:plastocyanin domain-containing protein
VVLETGLGVIKTKVVWLIKNTGLLQLALTNQYQDVSVSHVEGLVEVAGMICISIFV